MITHMGPETHTGLTKRRDVSSSDKSKKSGRLANLKPAASRPKACYATDRVGVGEGPVFYFVVFLCSVKL